MAPLEVRVAPLEVLLRLTLEVYAAPVEVLSRLTLEVYAAPLVVRVAPLEVLLHLPLRSVRRPLMSVWLPKLLPLEVPCAAPFEVPGGQTLRQNFSILGVFLPLRPILAIPYHITIQNKRFYTTLPPNSI